MYSHKFICFIIVFIAIISACAPSDTSADAQNPEIPSAAAPNYDAELAAQLGADEYGMRAYVFVTLNTGPADGTITDPARRQELFAGHFSNMGELAKQGKLVLAGPFIEGGDKRGLYIFNVTTIEEAKAIVQTDPAVAAGIFVPDYTKYYGSAALMKINELHNKIQKPTTE